MYFIARTNKLYHCLAHVSVRRRYMYTSLLMLCISAVWFFLLYYPLVKYEQLYEQERIALQKKYEKEHVLQVQIKDNIIVNDDLKKYIQSFRVSEDDYFKVQTLWFMETIQQQGLSLTSYIIKKEIDKKWYKKEQAHVVMIGTFNQILSFFDIIKNSQKMIVISHLLLDIVENSLFQVNFDINYYLII